MLRNFVIALALLLPGSFAMAQGDAGTDTGKESPAPKDTKKSGGKRRHKEKAPKASTKSSKEKGTKEAPADAPTKSE
jgi:hypothetical protein